LYNMSMFMWLYYSLLQMCIHHVQWMRSKPIMPPLEIDDSHTCKMCTCTWTYYWSKSRSCSVCGMKDRNKRKTSRTMWKSIRSDVHTKP
jgi:hypothetical protein